MSDNPPHQPPDQTEGVPSWIPWTPERLDRLRLGRRLTLDAWAEANVWAARGPRPGRWRPDLFPLMQQAMALTDRAHVREVTVVGPNRSGKTQTWIANPLARAIQEGREVLFLSANDELAVKAWEEIVAGMRLSPTLRTLLLSQREGGTKDARRFAGGSVVHVAGAGSIGQLGAFNAEYVFATEVSSMGDRFGARDGPLYQARARSDAFRHTRRITRESVVAGTDGAIWTDLLSAGCIYRPAVVCHRCGVSQGMFADTNDGNAPADPEKPTACTGKGGVRWSGDSPDQAERTGRYQCPHCGGEWGEPERQRALRDARWAPTGDPGASHIGFHFNSLVVPWETLGFAARDLCAVRRPPHSGSLYVIQDRLAIPWSPDGLSEGVIAAAAAVAGRVNGSPRGAVRNAGNRLVAFIDINAGFLTWSAVEWSPEAAGSVVDYGQEKLDRPMESLRDPDDRVRQAEEIAIDAGLGRLRERFAAGFADPASDRRRTPDLVLVDCGWDLSAGPVYRFTAAIPEWLPAKGFGKDVIRFGTAAHAPRNVVASGDGWRVVQLPEGQTLLVDVDRYKSLVHQGFALEPDKPGAISVFGADPTVHAGFADQVTAETFKREFIPGRPPAARWVQLRSANHYLDCMAGCRAAADMLGVAVLPMLMPSATAAPVGPDAAALLARHFARR